MVTYAHRCLHSLHPNHGIASSTRLLRISNVACNRRFFSFPLCIRDPFCSCPIGILHCVRAMGVDVVSSLSAQSLDQKKFTVIKSPSDDREYELLHLANGLSALLIHDPKILGDDDNDAFDEEEDDDEEYDDEDDDDRFEDGNNCADCAKNGVCGMHNDNSSEEGNSRIHESGSTKKMAAAALAVGVGSFADPKDAQGLFHFLEHMLFMGSSKFPDENEYDSFLAKHGGSSNAFTETEHTCFFFEVNHKFLKPALDRFSQFFVSPLIKEEAMEREVQAVDSEFEGHLQSDVVRLSQLQCNTALALHPFNCFSWGNRKSLSEPMARGIDMQSKLLQLYKHHYKAGCMKLAVISGESLETLKSWVTDLFSDVPQGLGCPLQLEWKGQVWESGKLYRIQSVKDQHFLSIIWPFWCLKDAYLKKPYDYISHLVGHEGTGSLFSLLKQNGWATNLSAGIGEGGFERCSVGYMFNVNIYLTDSGLEQVEEVVGLLYQYLKMIRDVGPQEWVHKEIKAMINMEFQFVEEDHPDTYVVNLASNMHTYPENHIIYGDFALELWDPDLIQRLLHLMVPSNMRLDIVTKSFDEKAKEVLHEPWFDFPYTVEQIPAEIMQMWENPTNINPNLHMPPVNEFIPSDFSLRDVESVDMETPPRVVLDDRYMKLWYKLDKKFRMPRANTYFQISCQGVRDSVKASVLTELYLKLLKDALNETLYLANVARLESSLAVVSDKLEIKLYGFSEKLSQLASKIAQFLKAYLPNADRFEVIKEDLLRGYANVNIKPSKHATYLRLQILKQQFFPVEDKRNILATIGVDDLIAFIPHLLGQIYIEAFCHGNLLEDEAIAIANLFKDSLALTPLPNAEEATEKILKLPSGSRLIYNMDAVNPMEENSAVEMYFQIEQDVGEQSIKARATYDLFESVISEPFFNELRTQEQLGYSLGCSARLTYRIMGFCFRLVSAKYSPHYVKGRIDKFIGTLKTFLEKISHEEFQSHVDSLIEFKLEGDHNLTEETDRLWLQITEKRYLFDIHKLEAEALRSITKADVITWYNTYLAPTSTLLRKLTVCVWGSNARDEKASKKASKHSRDVLIENLLEFKNQSEYFSSLC